MLSKHGDGIDRQEGPASRNNNSSNKCRGNARTRVEKQGPAYGFSNMGVGGDDSRTAKIKKRKKGRKHLEKGEER